MAKRFTFADAKARIKELEGQLDTSDNVYTSEENAMIKKTTSLKSWLIYMLWSLIPFIVIKWAIWGSKRFIWAQKYAQAQLIFIGIFLIPYMFFLNVVVGGAIGAAVGATAVHSDIKIEVNESDERLIITKDMDTIVDIRE